jgi:UDP-N-acetylglucosamine/UDP-N-acetylgalactosamine diphosphorylase
VTQPQRLERLRGLARKFDQEHLFEQWAQLTESERENLLSQLEQVDFNQLARQRSLLAAPVSSRAAALEPPDLFPLRRSGAQQARAQQAGAVGRELLSRGSVGFLVVAGGQASRLGHPGPKGTFPLGPLSGQSLFEIQARRLRAAGARYDFQPVWYVMTSPGNDAATREFFREHEWFGLPARDVVFFCQRMLPAVDPSGRILRAARGELFLAPGGHGGSLEALAQSGALADARARGLSRLAYFQVDNPLARPADPLFLGLHHLACARMSSKVVAKRNADEKVGVLARADGQMTCIEYSDLPEDLRQARDRDGQLRFRAGNIAAHVIDCDFVEELTRGGLDLPWHLARKRMSVWHAGRQQELEGIKFETFVFDALARSRESVVLEVDRAEEFSPVKNRSGEDSPESSRADLCRLYAGWASRAGHELPPCDASGCHPIEVDPLVAEDAEEFRRRAPRPERRGGGLWYR